MPQADNDFIPDEWQEDDYPIAHNQEAEQKPGLPPMQHGIPVPERPAREPIKPAEPGERAAPSKPAAPRKPQQDWTPLNFKDRAMIRDNQLFDRTNANLRFHVRQDLKKDLGKLLTAEQREGVAKMISQSKHHGLTRGKIQKGIQKMVEDQSLTRLQAKKLRHDLGATKRSSFF